MKDKILFYSLKTIEYSFYGLFFLVPLVLSNNTSELFELNKMWLTWGLTIVITTAWIIKMIAQKRFAIVKTPLDIPILLFLLSQIIATLLSQDVHISLWGYYSRFNGGLYSLLSYVVLYYAFVSNYHDIQDTVHKKSFDLLTRLGLLLGSALIIFVSIPLAAPSSSTSNGNPMVFFISLILALITLIFALRPGFFHRLLLTILYSGLIVTLWGIPSHFGSDPTCLLFRGTLSVECWTESFKPTVRIFSTLGQPAWMAAYLSFLIPLSVGLALNRISLLKTTFTSIWNIRFLMFFVLSLLFYLGLLFTNTRAGFLAFWIANAVLFGGVILLSRNAWRQILKVALTINLSFLLLTFLFGIPIGQLQKHTLPHIIKERETTQTPPQQTQEQPTQEETPQPDNTQFNITDSGEIRLNVWEGAIDAWHANPLFGTGVETFAFAYYQHKPEAQNLTSEWDFLYNKAHNEYLNYLATTGIVGLVTYLLLVAWFLFLIGKWAFTNSWISNAKYYEENPDLLRKRILILSLVSGYISILVSNFFGFSVVIIHLFFFLTPAFVLVLNTSLKRGTVFSFPKEKTDDSGNLSGMQITSMVFVLIIGFYMNMILLRYWNADKAYALGSNLNRVGDYGNAYSHLENAVKLRSGEPTFRDEWAFTNAAVASSFLLEEDATQAAAFIDQATTLSNSVVEEHPENVVFWKNRVRMYYLLSQVDPQFLPAALQSIQTADRLAPNDAKISYNHGVILGQMGRIDEAIDVLEKTVALKPDFRDAYYALALFYREQATDEAEQVVNPEMQQKAEEALEYILNNINSQDEQAIESLESWQ